MIQCLHLYQLSLTLTPTPPLTGRWLSEDELQESESASILAKQDRLLFPVLACRANLSKNRLIGAMAASTGC
jgi:hypothetical protein